VVPDRSFVAIGRRCRYAGGVLPAAVVIGDEENFGGGFTGRSPGVR
jgi:hypothetical protein